MAFDETLSDFFDTRGFAVTALFDGSVSVDGIFDAEYVEAFPGAEGVQTAAPRFTCAAADVPSPVGKFIEIESVAYRIKESQPDGTGIAVLVLRKGL